VAVSPIFWQRNLNLCGSPRSSSESRRPLDVISVYTRPGQHVTDSIGPYQLQVSGAEFGLGVRWRLALTSTGVPGPSLGNPPMVVFSLGLGGVPEEGPVATQHSGTLRVSRCASLFWVPGVYHLPALQLSSWDLRVACGRQKISRWPPTERVTSNRPVLVLQWTLLAPILH
jgi:hypothetical protein